MQGSLPLEPTTATPGARWSRFQRRAAPYLFVSPFFVLFLAFGLFPTLFSLYVSFHRWAPANGLGAMTWAGVDNYRFTLTDPWFWQSLGNTFWLAIGSGLPQHLIAIPLAFVLGRFLRRWQNLFSALYFLPYITSTVAIALVFTTLFSEHYGVINQAIAALRHLPLVGAIFPDHDIAWFGSAAFIKPSIAAVVVWRFFGFNTVLYLSGLQAIPNDLYEAAKVDGATTWQEFWHITLPLLRPIMYFAITLTIIGNLQLFDEPFILSGPTGGVGRSGLTTAVYLYTTAFRDSDMGTGAAMAWLLFIVIGALTFLNNRLFGRSGLARGE